MLEITPTSRYIAAAMHATFAERVTANAPPAPPAPKPDPAKAARALFRDVNAESAP